MNERYARGHLVRQEICFSDGHGVVFGEKLDEAFPLAVWNFVQLEDRHEYTSGRHFLGKDADFAGLDFDERVSAYKSSHPNVTEKYNYPGCLGEQFAQQTTSLCRRRDERRG